LPGLLVFHLSFCFVNNKIEVLIVTLFFFSSGTVVYFSAGVPADSVRRLKRLVLAFDGDVSGSLSSDVTHVVGTPEEEAVLAAEIAGSAASEFCLLVCYCFIAVAFCFPFSDFVCLFEIFL
jgi:hypothetical protein